MTEVERMIELIMNTPKIPVIINGRAQGRTYQTARNMAEHLIANGVIVLPCKVGDTLYIPYLSNVIEKTVCSIVIQKPFFTVYCGGTSLRFFKEDFGKTVFLTREDAEKALKEMR